MSNCTAIHETIIRDVLDVIDDVKSSDEIKGLRNRSGSFSSIAKSAQNLTCVFPVIIGSSNSIETAAMIAKAIERKAVSMLQILFTASSITNSKDGLEYLKNFHTNLKLDNGITVDGLIDTLDRYVIQKESMTVEEKEQYRLISEDVKRNLNYFLPDSISKHGLNECAIYPNGRIAMQSRGIDQNEIALENMINEAKKTTPTDVAMIKKTNSEFFKNQVISSDIKKANELVPTMMTIHFISTDSSEAIGVDMVIGVKAKMYLVDDMDIVNRISLKYQDKNSLIKFIRSTTREISFFKDFLFAIDKAKLDALSQSNRGSSNPMWKVLERRSLKSRIRRVLGQTNDASAITTLVVSQEIVEYLQKQENIDITKPAVARSIMESYNFMGMVIADESTEVARFMFDTGDDMYEDVAFSSLEKESNDNSKKIINLMNKMSR